MTHASRRDGQTQVENLCYGGHRARPDAGLPVPQEPALLTSAAMDGGAQAASSERRAGCPKRTSGDGAWAAPRLKNASDS